ncbi:alpha/beta fold hydrolase [Bacillus sp. Bva_UNVM-123]|uniref:alpha/beta fold hydrolase n=1 Tax=Bacillus sp. Bva_UNVM-123 TaxID=2829798 RepID=UPI00391F1940
MRVSLMNGKYIEVDSGVELFVQEIGSGEPLIFIPGFTFTTEVFSKQIEYFSKTHRVIVIDPRSHGRSTMSIHGNDYVTHGSDLASVLQALNATNVTLVGWSFGCLTVWEYIKQNGFEHVKSLILVDMPPKSLTVNDGEWAEGTLDNIAAIYNTYLRNSSGQREFITNYITQVMVQRKLETEELTWLVEQSLKTPYYIASNLFASGMFSDYREEAKQASGTVPILTVVAEHWADLAIRYTKQLTTQSKVEVLGGHMMFWEHSEKFNEIVDRFLSDH